MKKIGALVIVLISMILTSRAHAFSAGDYNLFSGDLVTLPAGKTINGDYFAAGKTIEISGIVTGDVYAAGGKIIVNGTIGGDLIAAGGEITLNGDVKQNVRIAGGQITLNGPVGGNLTIGGGNVDLTKDALLAGNLVAGVGNLNLYAPIKGNVRVGAGNVTIAGRIEGNVVGGIGKMLLTSTGFVKGDVVYWSENPTDFYLTPNATVSGKINHQNIPSQWEKWRSQVNRQTLKDTLDQNLNAFRLIGLLGSILLGFLIVHFLPNFSLTAIKAIEEQPWSVVFIGLTALILTPFVAIFLMFSLIGFSAGIIALILYGLALHFSRIFFMYWLGARFVHRLSREAGKTTTLLIGAGLYYVLTSLVVIGPIVVFLSLILGLGALLATFKQVYLLSRQQQLL